MISPRIVSGLTVTGVAAMLALVGGYTDNVFIACAYLIASIVAGIGAYVLLINGRSFFQKKTKIEERYLDLRKVAGVSDERLRQWYIPVAVNASNEALQFATRALARRQARILGVEKGPEEARKNRDRWTYAVYLVATSTYPSDTRSVEDSMEWLFMLVPESARQWLGGNSKVSRTMMDAIINQSPDNPIWRLVHNTKVVEPAVSQERNKVEKEPIQGAQKPANVLIQSEDSAEVSSISVGSAQTSFRGKGLIDSTIDKAQGEIRLET